MSNTTESPNTSIVAALTEAQSALTALLSNHAELNKIDRAAQSMIECLSKQGTIFSCGNGGSMCDAMHFAEELTGRYRKNRKGYAAVSISDPSHLSCVANDFGYEEVFSRYLQSHGAAGDCLVALTTSGNSKNVIKAVEYAQQEGITSIVLAGRVNPDLAAMSDLYICTAGGEFADRVQELHIKLLHIFIEQIERHFHPELYA